MSLDTAMEVSHPQACTSQNHSRRRPLRRIPASLPWRPCASRYPLRNLQFLYPFTLSWETCNSTARSSKRLGTHDPEISRQPLVGLQQSGLQDADDENAPIMAYLDCFGLRWAGHGCWNTPPWTRLLGATGEATRDGTGSWIGRGCGNPQLPVANRGRYMALR